MRNGTHQSERHRRDFVSRVWRQNQEEFGPNARSAVEQMLSAGHSHPWTYVYELTQNAIDAGARRVAWQRIGEDTIRFQHDGEQALDDEHVRALASSADRQRDSPIGFMEWFQVACPLSQREVSGRCATDSHRPDQETWGREYALVDTLCRRGTKPNVKSGAVYTTVFQLSQPADARPSLGAGLNRLAAPTIESRWRFSRCAAFKRYAL